MGTGDKHKNNAALFDNTTLKKSLRESMKSEACILTRIEANSL